MKKILSLIASLALVLSAFTATSFAAASDVVKVTVSEPAKVELSEYNTNTGATRRGTALDDSYEAYKIEVDLSDMPTISSTVWDTGDYDGFQLLGFALQYNVNDLSILDTTATHALADKGTMKASSAWNTTDKQITFTLKNPYPGDKQDGLTVTAIDNAYVIYFAVKKGSVATFTLNDVTTSFQEYFGGKAADGAVVEKHSRGVGYENLTINSTSFTIGEAAPQDVEVSSLVLNAETKTIETNATFDLTATINADATNKAIAFTVTDEEGNATEGATISAASVTAGADGTAKVTVTGVTAGKYKVTATAGSLSKTCVVTVNAPTPAGFTFSVNDVVVGSEGVAGISVTTVESEGITGGLNGLVWDKCVLSNINTNLYKYVAKFTADDVEPKLSALTNLPETEGASITFDTVLKFADEVKTNVKLTVEQAAK